MSIQFVCITRSEATQHELFDLARSIDTHEKSMAHSQERAIGGVKSGLISLGEEVTWRGRHFGVQFRMTSRVTEMKASDYFIDEQVNGPFKSFRHVHEFVQEPTGTVMIDRIHFEAPFGFIGRIAERLVLEAYLKRIIETRATYLAANDSKPTECGDDF